MRAFLPDDDPDPRGRAAWLERQRADYRWDHDYLPPVCVLQELPKAESFTPAYYGKRLVPTLPLVPNSALAWLRTRLTQSRVPEDLARLFFTLPKPEVIADWRSDAAFARQRLAGPNPMRIRRLQHPDEIPFHIGEGGVGAAIPGTSLRVEDAVKDGTLYLSDYGFLSSIRGGDYGGLQRSMPAPRALFQLRRDDGAQAALHPVAIELSPGGAVRTPTANTPLDWLAAKIWLQVADGNDLELGSHLARTHLVMGPFGVSTPRQLGERHPVALLLRPHLRFMLANTRLGRHILLAPGSLADQLCAGGLEGTFKLVSDSVSSWSLTQQAFPADLADRQLADTELLSDFPYRDDGSLLWSAIREYVGSYLTAYYPEPGDVGRDSELQAWAAELASPDGGKVRDMPARIEHRDELRDILTIVLFTCGPQHALVNYGQYAFFAFVPNMPLAAYRELDGDVHFESEAELMAMLPPDDNARRQLQVMNLLSAYHHDRLGHYPRDHFSDPAALEAMGRFQQRLDEIEATIDARNRERTHPYEFLKPSQVTNSISI